MPETLRSIVGDGSIPPPSLNMSPIMLLRKRRMNRELKANGGEKEHIERPPRRPVSMAPCRSDISLIAVQTMDVIFHLVHTRDSPQLHRSVIFVPGVLLSFVSHAYFATQTSAHLVRTLYSTALRNSYGLNDLQIGLAYL